MTSIQKQSLLRVSILGAAAILVCLSASAAIDPNSLLNDVTSKGKQLGTSIISLLSWVLLAIGAILVVVQTIKFMRNDPQASDVYMKLGIGLVVGFGVLQIISSLMSQA